MDYLLGLISIIAVNLLLSGDNALVIALASRRLAPKQQKQALVWGSAGAIILRALLTFAAIFLLQIPYLQMAGGLALLWIAVKLIADEGERRQETFLAKNTLAEAIQTIIAADLLMSLDNVIAIAGVAKGNVSLLIAGLAVSIPIIIGGSKLIGMLMNKWPAIITIGAAFLGWTAGEMVIADKKVLPLALQYPWIHWGIPIFFAIVVVIAGKALSQHKHTID
ncbi:MAG: TerC family protein [Veillonellales bacterium]